MSHPFSPLVDASELKSLIDKEGVAFIHAGSGAKAKDLYDKSHIQGALFVDLDTDLSEIGPNAANGGRHPLPSPAKFASLLGNLGIAQDSHVVVYDDQGGANVAARFWWMLKALGHEKVQVLNGGLQAAISSEIPVDDRPAGVQAREPYPADQWKLPMVDMDEVERSVNDPESVVIDVRQAFRYNGESEPIDLIAGHIPGAINVPLAENLDPNGRFLSPKELREKYEPLISGKEVTIHCGSGVTACHTILALTSAGFEIPKLYVGSWSEWSRNDKAIATSYK